MNELVTRLRRIAGEGGSIGDTGTTNREAATEIEHLEAELAESRKKLAQSMGYALKADEQCNEIKAELAAANAKITEIRRYAAEQLGWNEYHYGPQMAHVLAKCGSLVTPKPTDNGEDAT